MKDRIAEPPDLFRELDPEEESDFKQWARDNWSVDQKVNSVWHPIVVEECAVMLDDHIRKHTKKMSTELWGTYDEETQKQIGNRLDWNFSYSTSSTSNPQTSSIQTQTVAIDSSDEISEKEQYEMAIEHFWEIEWERLTNGES